MKAIRRHGISLVKIKENINTQVKGKYLAGNTFKCKRWMFWGVWIMNHLFLLYFLVFVKQT